MRIVIAFIAFTLFLDCQKEKAETSEDIVIDTVSVAAEPEIVEPKPTTHSNERFRNVAVESLDNGKFRISGEAQIFEANFSWVVEDGHNELAKGYEMTDAGAPEWGKFDFVVDVQKARENSTLMLILFESSPKDGSRQYELPVGLQ